MKKTIFISLLLLFSCSIYAQDSNYKNIRKSLCNLSCKPNDSLELARTKKQLEAFDISKIDSNIHLYYHDLAWCYYKHYLKTKDLDFIKKAVLNYEKAIFNKKDFSSAFWNLAYYQKILGNCEKAKYYLKKYKKVTPKKYQDKTQIKHLKRNCKT